MLAKVLFFARMRGREKKPILLFQNVVQILNTEPLFSSECGTNAKRFQTRIVGGRPADPDEWPWLAALVILTTTTSPSPPPNP